MNAELSKRYPKDSMKGLVNLTATVYLCQVLSFILAGIPLLVGVAINLYKQDAVQDTWLAAHFEWQIKTAWVVLAGFALTGLTFEFGLGIFVLTATVVWFIYRIAIGWYALNDKKAPKESN